MEGIIEEELREVREIDVAVLVVRQFSDYWRQQLLLNWDFEFSEHCAEVVFVQLAPSADVELVENLPEDELLVCSVGFLQQFKADGLEGRLDLFNSGSAFLLEFYIPLRADKSSKGLVTWDIDGEIGIKVDKLVLSDISFRSDWHQIQELLQNDILVLISELELLEIRSIEPIACIGRWSTEDGVVYLACFA